MARARAAQHDAGSTVSGHREEELLPRADDVRADTRHRSTWLLGVAPLLWAVLGPQVAGRVPYSIVLGFLLAWTAYVAVTAWGWRRRRLAHLEEHGMTLPLVIAQVRDEPDHDLTRHPAHGPWEALLDRARTATTEIDLLVADLPDGLAERLVGAATTTTEQLLDVLTQRDALGWDPASDRSVTMAERYLAHAEALVVQLETAAARLLEAAAPMTAGDLEGETEALLEAWAEVEAADRSWPEPG